MDALPFYYLTLRSHEPRNPASPEHLITLGDHLRKRRIDLGLHQKDMARIVNATISTITNWEKNRVEPTLRFIPKIIEVIGYDKHAITIGEQIRDYRRKQGLSIKKLTRMLKIDPTNLARWERAQCISRKLLIDPLVKLFDSNS